MDETTDGGEGRYEGAEYPKKEKDYDNGFKHDQAP
jgi:hypothetical protein